MPPLHSKTATPVGTNCTFVCGTSTGQEMRAAHLAITSVHTPKQDASMQSYSLLYQSKVDVPRSICALFASSRIMAAHVHQSVAHLAMFLPVELAFASCGASGVEGAWVSPEKVFQGRSARVSRYARDMAYPG